jgi:hypothetical protein
MSVLLHDEGFSHLVCLDELYRNQHRLPKRPIRTLMYTGSPSEFANTL